MKNEGYIFFDHTADIGVEIFAKELSELFVFAARAMFDVITDDNNFEAKKTLELKVDASDPVELMHKWLSELLYIFESKGIYFTDFKIDEISEKSLKAKVGGENYENRKGELEREIKAVTYHQMKVVDGKDGWRARVIFDI